MALSRRFIARFGLDNNGQPLVNIGSTGANLSRSGAHDLTLVTGGITSATLPSGTITLADLSTNQTFSGNKTFTGTFVANGTGNQLSISGTGSTVTINPATTGSISNVSASFTSATVTGQFVPHGYAFKACAQAATTGLLTLNTAQTSIDGVTLTATDRVLVKNQTNSSENGIYTNVTTTSWTRVADADTASELSGAVISIDRGTVNGGKVFTTNFKSTDTLGTTNMIWSELGASGINIVDDTTSNTTAYLTFTTATSGSINTENVSSTKLTYNPSTGTVSATDFNSTSDFNLKKNFVSIDGLSVVTKLKGWEYDFIESDIHASGVIAQEIEQILPHVVSHNGIHKTVSYTQIIPYLIEAIKEQQIQIDALKAQLNK